MDCAKCGKTINDARARFCPFCGGALQSADASEPRPAPPPAEATPVHPAAETLLVPARCAQSRRPFLIRMKRMSSEQWNAVGASIVGEERLRNPEFGHARISGRLKIGGDYPGCPHCGRRSLFVDGRCGSRISCMEPDADHTECPWCGNGAQAKILRNTTIKGMGDG